VSELRKFADGNGGTGTLRHSLSLLIFDRRRRLAQQPRRDIDDRARLIGTECFSLERL